MPNTWDYTVLLPQSKAPRVTLSEILQLSESLGWVLPEPVHTFDGNGNEVVYESRIAFVDGVAKFGGGFTLWREPEDVFVTCFENHVSFTSQHNLSQERDQAKAASLEELFVAACEQMQPAYGYSIDDWWWFNGDAQGLWERHEKSVENCDEPEVLCWLNYFPMGWFTKRIAQQISGVPHRLVKCGSGALVYLADAPWNSITMTRVAGVYRLISG